MNYLITGGSGFIGSYVIAGLKEGNTVSCLDKIPPTNNGCKFIRADIENEKELKAIEEQDTVIHLAGMSNYLLCEKNPALAYKINVEGTRKIFENLKDIKKFLFLSTVMVYANSTETLDENSPVSPGNIYAKTKLEAEKICEKYASEQGIDYSCLRLTSVYGPKMRKELAIYKFIEQSLHKGSLTIWGDGNQNRNFLYATDAASVVKKATESMKGNKVYNIAGNENISINEVVNEIARNMPDIKKKYLAKEKGHIENLRISIKKAEKELNYLPKIKFSEGIKKCIESIKRESLLI